MTLHLMSVICYPGSQGISLSQVGTLGISLRKVGQKTRSLIFESLVRLLCVDRLNVCIQGSQLFRKSMGFEVIRNNF